MKQKKTKRGVDISQTIGMKEKKKKPTWLLLLHRSHAMVFEYEETSDSLKKVHDLAFPEGRMKSRELLSDQPGRSFDSWTRSPAHTATPRHSLSSEDSTEKKQLETVASTAATWAEQGHARKSFDKLIVVADPQSLGIVRSKLSDAIQATIAEEYEKDLAWVTEPELERRLLDLIGKKGEKPRHVPPPLGAYRLPND